MLLLPAHRDEPHATALGLVTCCCLARWSLSLESPLCTDATSAAEAAYAGQYDAAYISSSMYINSCYLMLHDAMQTTAAAHLLGILDP
jgi:hypothetical protein